MSFLKIKDPEKRELMVKEFLETKKNIQQSQLRERVGEREFQEDLGKFFKPVTDVQKATVEEIKEELQPLKNLLVLPGPVGSQEMLALSNAGVLPGSIAYKYLSKLAEKEGSDKTFGVYVKDTKFYIGNKPLKFKDNNIIIDGDEYIGTEGLWELIISKIPNREKITEEDLENFEEIMERTNAIYQNNNPSSIRPKSSKSYKYRKYINPIWKKITTPALPPLFTLPTIPTFTTTSTLLNFFGHPLPPLDRDTDPNETFGIYVKDGKYYIGDAPVEFNRGTIKVKGKEFEGTEGLADLLLGEKPWMVTEPNFEKFKEILFLTNSIFKDNDPETKKMKPVKSEDFEDLVKPTWQKSQLHGQGLSDPNVLLERLDLLIESKKAGNTGVQNEIISICDNLKKQNILNSKEYKKIITKC